MSPVAKAVARGGIAILIVALGAGVMGMLVKSRAPAEAKPDSDTGVVVRTARVKAKKQLATVAAQGTVLPARQVTLQPEVQGRVIYRSDNLVPGGRFKKGEVLLRIDASEYALRAKQSASQVEQAQQQLLLEESRGELAEHEWKLIGEDDAASDVGRNVALRKPQLKEAEARMQLAESDRSLAVLNVGRATLTAPFNGFVKEGTVNVGQFISPASALGILVGSDEFWVQVSVPVESLSSILVPGFNAKEDEGSKVSVWQEIGEKRIVRMGKVVRLYGDVDPAGRMARVLTRVEDPLGLDSGTESPELPLLLGSYVHIDIEGQEMVDVVEVPRAAVHAGRFVYLYGDDGTLVIREVKIAWRKPNSLLISAGLKDGDEIITSRLGNAVEGLKLRRADPDSIGATSHNVGDSAPDDGARKHAQAETEAEAQAKHD